MRNRLKLVRSRHSTLTASWCYLHSNSNKSGALSNKGTHKHMKNIGFLPHPKRVEHDRGEHRVAIQDVVHNNDGILRIIRNKHP